MANESSRKYWICCPLCDNEKCVKGTDKCEAEMWEAEKKEEMKNENGTRME
jgi:hypothetical protein